MTTGRKSDRILAKRKLEGRGQTMKHNKLYLVLTVAGMVFLLLTEATLAQKATFREDFIRNYVSNRFKEQVLLVKQNKAKIPGEVHALVTDAMAAGRPFDQRMNLLDIAQAMASMHKHWNNDEKPLAEVEVLIRMEIEKENKRKAELEKWDKYEKFVGNFVMKEHEKQMAEEGLTPVIYPHWVHRTWFECKVCHQDIFKMKKGVNDISQTHILEGTQCGVCHNNDLAFGADKTEYCVKCHSAGKEEADHLYDMENVDHKRLKEVAERLGAQWRHANLPDGKMPLDRFGNIDWLELQKKEVFSPVVSLRKDFKDETADTNILLESTNSTIDYVLFSHKVHSTWIRCDTCHPSLFKDELGANDIKMRDMAQGKFCGHCHGKVSFSFADCMRCHNHPRGEPAEGALIHKAKP
jgi:c(7)-type cytochrome triheme protein